jgi:hypothetical protein
MKSKTQRFLALGLVAIGSVLPWASAFGVSISGIRGDGVITLLLAGVAGTLLFLGRPRRAAFDKGISLLIGGLIIFTAAYHLGEFVASGVYVTLFAGVAYTIVSLRTGKTLPTDGGVEGAQKSG